MTLSTAVVGVLADEDGEYDHTFDAARRALPAYKKPRGWTLP
jgi:hypothetical protein